MPPHRFIYLASQSPRRAHLLELMGVAHRPLIAGREEDVESLEQEMNGEKPEDYVRRVTLLKLAAARRRLVARGLANAPILCADTTVALGRRILGTPADDAAAVEMLRALSGRTHRVLSAVAVAAGRRSQVRVNVSRVRFAPLPERTIRAYVASGEPRGKAGAYAVQGRIAAWIEHLEGSYSGVMGLPLFETRQLLARARVSLSL
jgi:septum formation protein